MSKKLDKVDLKILSDLSVDAQKPYTEVAKSANVSSGTVHLRMKKMVDAGMVKGTTLSMNYAFVGIYLKDTSKYTEAYEALKAIPEVVKIHYTTGRFNVFIKIHARDNHHLKEILQEKVEPIPLIRRTETFLSLEESLNRHILFDETT